MVLRQPPRIQDRYENRYVFKTYSQDRIAVETTKPFILILVRKRGLEPLSLAALAPKSGASAIYLLYFQQFEKVEKHEWQF